MRFFFPCFIRLVRLSNTMMNRSGGKRYPSLFLILGRKVFSFSPLNITLVVGFSQMFYIRFRKFSFMTSVLRNINDFQKLNHLYIPWAKSYIIMCIIIFTYCSIQLTKILLSTFFHSVLSLLLAY